MQVTLDFKNSLKVAIELIDIWENDPSNQEPHYSLEYLSFDQWVFRKYEEVR